MRRFLRSRSRRDYARCLSSRTPREWITENPAVHLKGPKVRSNRTLPFCEEEMKNVLAATTDPRVKALIWVIRHAGLRIPDVTTPACSSLQGERLQLYQTIKRRPANMCRCRCRRKYRTLGAQFPRGPRHFFWSAIRRYRGRCRCGASQ